MAQQYHRTSLHVKPPETAAGNSVPEATEPIVVAKRILDLYLHNRFQGIRRQ
jgi:hypothetical protein